ncbi:MAG: hypothetical protein MJ092_06770 [Lachnospiraceae bacterium]|nr:hypothetical protein [Lachnospiraceae bacterium]
MDTKIEPNPTGKSFLRVAGIIMTAFGGLTIFAAVLYFIIGLLAVGAFVEDIAVTSIFFVGGGVVLLYLLSGSILSLIAGIIGIVNAGKAQHSTKCLVWGIITLAFLAIESFGIFLIVIMSDKTGADLPMWSLFFSNFFCLGAPVLYVIGAVLNKKSYNQRIQAQ